MAAQETYKHAPSIEAVLDIRTRLSSGLTQESLDEIYEGEKERYPTIRQPFQVKFTIEQKQPDTEPVTDASSSVNGRIFASSNGLQLFQARPDGFSHNRLAPYQDWNSFQSEARRLWVKFRDVAKPEVIELLGLTFINRVSMPGGARVEDYFNVYVEVPETLPQTLETHNFAILTTDPESNAKIGVAVNFGSLGNDGNVQVILNIQAYITPNRPSNQLSEDEIWSTFDTLRALKNLAFESSITDKLRAGFR